MGMRVWVLAAAVAVLAVRPVAAEIKLGWAGPLSGGGAAVGQQNLDGARQAVDDLNAAGGLLGERVTLSAEDDAGDPKQAVSVANRLAGRGVRFVVGHQNSGASIPASSVYAEEGVLQVSPASTSPQFTDRGLWNTFRVCGRDDQQGVVAGNHLLHHHRARRIYVVHDKTTYGRGLAGEVKKTLNGAGVQEAAFEGIDVGEKDFSALVSKMKAAGADVVYFGGVYTEAALLSRQMRDQGLAAPMIGGDALFSPEFPAIAGPGAEGTLVTFSPDAKGDPVAAPTLARLETKGVAPDGMTLYGYAAVQVIAQAVQAAGKADAKLAARALHSGQGFDTAVGRLSFDGKGDVTRPGFVLYRLSDGRFRPAGGE